MSSSEFRFWVQRGSLTILVDLPQSGSRSTDRALQVSE